MTEELEQLEHVITVSVIRGASIKPPGDVVTVHALNRGAGQVMRLAEATRKQGRSRSRRPSRPASSIPSTSGRVTSGVDKALWEEAEGGLRHQSQITANYPSLMP